MRDYLENWTKMGFKRKIALVLALVLLVGFGTFGVFIERFVQKIVVKDVQASLLEMARSSTRWIATWNEDDMRLFKIGLERIEALKITPNHLPNLDHLRAILSYTNQTLRGLACLCWARKWGDVFHLRNAQRLWPQGAWLV